MYLFNTILMRNKEINCAHLESLVLGSFYHIIYISGQFPSLLKFILPLDDRDFPMVKMNPFLILKLANFISLLQPFKK